MNALFDNEPLGDIRQAMLISGSWLMGWSCVLIVLAFI